MRLPPIAVPLWVALCLLASCAQGPDQPEPAPALWEITARDGEYGYLFGTVHALPNGLEWRTDRINEAFAEADVLAVEIATFGAQDEMRNVFDYLAITPGQPPLSERVSPENRELAFRVMKDFGLKDGDYSELETWAVALALSQLASIGDSENGVDRALVAAAQDKRVVELEGIEAQLGLFDTLPEQEQVDLLEYVMAELDELENEEELDPRLHAWLTGDVGVLGQEAHAGLLADPELREVLLVQRNREWTSRIEALFLEGGTPFIAAGAAHMLGPDGLPALLEARGFSVRRVQ